MSQCSRPIFTKVSENGSHRDAINFEFVSFTGLMNGMISWRTEA